MLLPDGTPDNFADTLAQLQNVHVFVSVLGGCQQRHAEQRGWCCAQPGSLLC